MTKCTLEMVGCIWHIQIESHQILQLEGTRQMNNSKFPPEKSKLQEVWRMRPRSQDSWLQNLGCSVDLILLPHPLVSKPQQAGMHR